MGGLGLDRTDIIFKKFADHDWIGYNFFRSGLDSDWKFSQPAHLWAAVRCRLWRCLIL